MHTIIRISKKLEGLVQDRPLNRRPVVKFETTNSGLWLGTKRYAH